MNKNFWLFTVVCALFVSAVTTVLSLSGALALPVRAREPGAVSWPWNL